MALVAAATGRASAEDATLPVPAVTIYPGDTIRDSMLNERDLAVDPSGTPFADSRGALVGKVARRTLLPGKPVPLSAVAEPNIVSNGSQVTIVFKEGGLTIVSYAAALQQGKVGDLIRVRNLDSGLIVSGTIGPDGTVTVSGG